MNNMEMDKATQIMIENQNKNTSNSISRID